MPTTLSRRHEKNSLDYSTVIHTFNIAGGRRSGGEEAITSTIENVAKTKKKKTMLMVMMMVLVVVVVVVVAVVVMMMMMMMMKDSNSVVHTLLGLFKAHRNAGFSVNDTTLKAYLQKLAKELGKENLHT
jgi:membrane-anchored glycerophosphoryl diester phosphodiesterase (GDPDase)